MKNRMKLHKDQLFAMALVLALVLSLCAGAMANGDQSISCVKAQGNVLIDGDLSEWNTSSPVMINAIEQVVRDVGQWTGPEDVSVEAYLMWDEANLYLAAKILDDTPFMYREGFPPDMADSLVLFLSTDPNADADRTQYATNDFRVTMVIDDYYFNTGIDRTMVADKMGFESLGADGDLQVLNGYQSAVKVIDGGYVFESVIPFANFANDNIATLVPQSGMTVGMELGMFDLDFPCPGVATVRIEWCANADADINPSVWGNMIFCE